MMTTFAHIPEAVGRNAIERRKMELQDYLPALTLDKACLERFWLPYLEQSGKKPLRVRRELADPGLFPGAEVYRLAYEGYDDTVIHGWYIVPSTKLRQGDAGAALSCTLPRLYKRLRLSGAVCPVGDARVCGAGG